MEIKISNAEMKIMEILWKNGDVRASYIADTAQTEIGWERNTTYTFLNRLIKKGAVKRSDPGFMCTAVFQRQEVLTNHAKNMIDKFYNGSIELFMQAFLSGDAITHQEKEKLQKMIENYNK